MYNYVHLSVKSYIIYTHIYKNTHILREKMLAKMHFNQPTLSILKIGMLETYFKRFLSNIPITIIQA